MQILLDANVVLDVLLARSSWVTDAASVWQAVDDGRIGGFVSALTVANVFYIVRRAAGMRTAHMSVRVCLDTFMICPVDGDVLQQAAALASNDFADNIQIVCAQQAKLDAIVTRDPAGFRSASIPVVSPADLVRQL